MWWNWFTSGQHPWDCFHSCIRSLKKQDNAVLWRHILMLVAELINLIEVRVRVQNLYTLFVGKWIIVPRNNNWHLLGCCHAEEWGLTLICSPTKATRCIKVIHIPVKFETAKVMQMWFGFKVSFIRPQKPGHFVWCPDEYNQSDLPCWQFCSSEECLPPVCSWTPSEIDNLMHYTLEYSFCRRPNYDSEHVIWTLWALSLLHITKY